MTKIEFNTLKNKCPWLRRFQDQPYCIATSGTVDFNWRQRVYNAIHCAKKNCAILYWLTATSGNLEGGD